MPKSAGQPIAESAANSPWTLASRTRTMVPSVLREILKLTESPGIISFAGGLPAPECFPLGPVRAACDAVLHRHGAAALQYGPSEGLGPLREFIAASLPWRVTPGQVLITSGSQQGFDLVGKVLLDGGSRVLVESPAYLGALQAFKVLDANILGVDQGAEGLDLDDLVRKRIGARLLYIQPNFQNPTGRCLSAATRRALGARLHALGLPFLEDDPYGALWFDQAPPPPLAAHFPDQGIYLGSFSKVLAPGLRLGFLVAPDWIFPKLLQAKQAAYLHTSTFDQRVAWEVIQGGFMAEHLQTVRAHYRQQRERMLNALAGAMQGLGVQWNSPGGGMFLWLRLPAGLDAEALLGRALARGVAFVPGAPFHAGLADRRTLRLSFATANAAQIEQGIFMLAEVIRSALAASTPDPSS